MAYSGVANTTFSYLLTMYDYRNDFPEEYKPSYVKITTITMVSSFETTINIEKLKTVFDTSGSIFIRMKDGASFEWKRKMTTFYNQITLNYTDEYSTKSIKVFPNGSIQVAGCADLFDCHRVIRMLNQLFATVLEMSPIPPDKFKVVMINSNFSVNHSINLMAVTQIFGKHPNFAVSFDPDRYSAVKVKFSPDSESSKKVTASIFSTGKVIVTGAETLKEIVFAYHFITTKIYAFRQEIMVTPAATKDLFDTFMGYKVEEVAEAVKGLGIHPWHEHRTNYKINFSS